MGGSMHLIDIPNGLFGTVPIVGATIPIAVGAGIAAKMDGNNDMAVSFFGDGATEEGAFHESMNLAATMKAPVESPAHQPSTARLLCLSLCRSASCRLGSRGWK